MMLNDSAARGQAITEYAIVIGIVVTALFTMQTFIRRYVQSEIKSTSDDFLAISMVDGTNPDPNQRGMETQILGTEQYENNSGIRRSNDIFHSNSTLTRTLVETPDKISGKLYVSTDQTLATRDGQQRVEQARRTPPRVGLPPAQWFKKPDDSNSAVAPRRRNQNN